jgi:hypothetical protein
MRRCVIVLVVPDIAFSKSYRSRECEASSRSATAVCAAEADAEKEFQEALGFARMQRVLSYELRAAHSMANLMRRSGDEAGALALLGPVFNQFTEGFDTADLISAGERSTR